MQLVEFAAGVSPDAYLGTEGVLKSQKFLVQRLCELNLHMGRRARELVLPPKWTSVGFYRVDIQHNIVWIEHRFAAQDARRQLPPSQARLVHDHKALKVERNWSEMNAMLTETHGILRHKIHLMLSDMGCEDPLQNVSAIKAIEDGVPESPRVKSDITSPPSSKRAPSTGAKFRRALRRRISESSDQGAAPVVKRCPQSAPDTSAGSVKVSASVPCATPKKRKAPQQDQAATGRGDKAKAGDGTDMEASV